MKSIFQNNLGHQNEPSHWSQFFITPMKKPRTLLQCLNFCLLKLTFQNNSHLQHSQQCNNITLLNFHALQHLQHCNNFFTHSICDNSSISNSNSMDIAMENSIFSMDITTNGRGEG
jgi:hypothetical protein